MTYDKEIVPIERITGRIMSTKNPLRWFKRTGAKHSYRESGDRMRKTTVSYVFRSPPLFLSFLFFLLKVGKSSRGEFSCLKVLPPFCHGCKCYGRLLKKAPKAIPFKSGAALASRPHPASQADSDGGTYASDIMR